MVAKEKEIQVRTLRGLPKLLKELSYVDIWPFYGKVKFASLCICMSSIHLNSKIVENFKGPLQPLSQICSNFILSLLRSGEQRIAKMIAVHWPRWPPCPYMVKPFENLLLQNWGCLGTESVHKSLGTGDLPKLLKRLSYVNIWPFYGKVKFASLCICMSPITFVWENCWEFQTTSPLKPLSSNLLKFLAHLCLKCSWWAIVVSQCPSWGVNNCFKRLLLYPKVLIVFLFLHNHMFWVLIRSVSLRHF